jgi:uncharacterized SAM-binding protein YcdF (DUF218 family)
MALKETVMEDRSKRLALRLIGFSLALLLGICAWVYALIREQASRDEAQSSACIVVMGAAQYNGRPSPVLKARLDHALNLYHHGLAPRIITTGGYGIDKRFTEAGVAKEYLVRRGVPAEFVEGDPHGETTYQSVLSLKRKLSQLGTDRCIVVSDGFHLYRTKALFAQEGIVVYASPAAGSPIEGSVGARFWHSLREVFVYAAFRLGLRV